MPASGYTAITFVANEQPTTAKWNLIGSNDASFNTGDGFNDEIILDRHIGPLELKTNKLENPYIFAAYRNAALNIASSVAAIPFDTEHFDIGGNFNTANGKFTAPVDGYYTFYAGLLASYAAGNHVYFGMLKNDAEYKRYGESDKAAGNQTDGVCMTIYLDAGDTAALYFSCNATRAVLVASAGKYAWFGGHLTAAA